LQKKVETMEAPQNRRLCGKMECLPTIYVRRGGLWAKHMGLKRGAIGNLGNILGTHWELEGNMLETKEKRKKILSPPCPHPKLKRKKIKAC
jgi:hypothetical protein